MRSPRGFAGLWTREGEREREERDGGGGGSARDGWWSVTCACVGKGVLGLGRRPIYLSGPK